jgi:hypothetical protein
MKQLKIKENDGRVFYYADFGYEAHGRTSFRLWVHHKLVSWNDDLPYLEIPRRGISLQEGKKAGTWILRPGEENLFEIYVPCGYRGSASFEILTPVTATAFYSVYQSPRGSCGISEGALISTAEEAVVHKWERTGRLYGDPPTGITKIDIEGKMIDLEGLEDACEIEDLAEVK